MKAILHYLGFIFTDSRVQSDHLPVQIGKAYAIVIDKKKMSYAPARKAFGGIGTNAAEAKNGDLRIFQNYS